MSTLARPPRTELERLIRERRRTLEEFSEDAARYAQQNQLDGTVSTRHLQRLAAGQRADGRPLGPLRPATRLLLEQMLGRPIEELLGPPGDSGWGRLLDNTAELSARFAASRAVDLPMVRALQEQVDLARVIDRRLGGVVLLAELSQRIKQLQELLSFSLNAETRQSLAAVLVDACTLAGWLALDQGILTQAWRLYDRARTAARESESPSLEAYACAGQSTVLLDIGAATAAVELTGHAEAIARNSAPALLRAWIAGAHGEACAASGNRGESLRAFDAADRLISDESGADVPFLVFGSVHLARWRGHALARLGDPESVHVLSDALDRLDKTFVRAEAALQADMSDALTRIGGRDAAIAHAERCLALARQIGSVRNVNKARTALAATRN